ncbi:MAG TPA: hypothetical protein VMW81_08190 [Nitrospinota bacterium]|nr:hypothetical protein [Nitrospinota bacterium]
METKEKNRKNYKKPQINHVNLVIEEAVLQACKTSAGDASAKKGAGCAVVQCSTIIGS